jgi:hypothetical protein
MQDIENEPFDPKKIKIVPARATTKTGGEGGSGS